MAIINKANLAKYLELNYNVMFRGRHGVGKTAIIKEVFEKANLRWRYFSASTLDPWVDFVGMPRPVTDENGREVIKLIRPAFIEYDEVEALFFDEFNRAPEKVINATMELLQFKSINGHRLKNLKVIWIAINPSDEEDTYAVNNLDPAHEDRFQVQIDVPFKVDEEYFLGKYPKIGKIFMDWWEEMNHKDLGYIVSPRRLDYAADAYQNNCRLEDFLPSKSNPKKLRDMLKSMPFLEKIMAVTSEAQAIEFLRDANNTTKMLDMIKAAESTAIQFFKKYGAHVPKELAEPFVDYLQARKEGFEIFDNVRQMIEKLPDTKGDQKTAALINNVDFGRMFAKGGSLKNDLIALNATEPQLIKKLANRVADVLKVCQVTTLERVLWGTGGKRGNQPTNFQTITNILSGIGGAFGAADKVTINNKVYRNKLIDNMNWL